MFVGNCYNDRSHHSIGSGSLFAPEQAITNLCGVIGEQSSRKGEGSIWALADAVAENFSSSDNPQGAKEGEKSPVVLGTLTWGICHSMPAVFSVVVLGWCCSCCGLGNS